MTITYNGVETELAEGTTLADLAAEYKEKNKVRVVGAWVNDAMVRMGTYKEVVLQEGDRVTIRKIGGGG